MDYLLFVIDILSYVIPIILLIGTVMGFLVYRQFKTNRFIKLMFFLFFLSILNDLFSRITPVYFDSNLIFINTYSLVELIILYLYLKNAFIEEKKVFKHVFVLLVLFNIFEFFTVDFHDYLYYQSYSKSLNSLFLLILSIFLILSYIKLDRFENVNRVLFLLPIYLTINSLIGLPLNLLINYVDESVYYIWMINTLNSLTFYSVLIFTTWKYGKTLKA